MMAKKREWERLNGGYYERLLAQGLFPSPVPKVWRGTVKKPGKRRMQAWRTLGQDQPIEPLDAGLKRVVSNQR